MRRRLRLLLSVALAAALLLAGRQQDCDTSQPARWSSARAGRALTCVGRGRSLRACDDAAGRGQPRARAAVGAVGGVTAIEKCGVVQCTAGCDVRYYGGGVSSSTASATRVGGTGGVCVLLVCAGSDVQGGRGEDAAEAGGGGGGDGGGGDGGARRGPAARRPLTSAGRSIRKVAPWSSSNMRCLKAPHI